MSHDLTRLFHPITATPFERTAYYAEIPSCEALRPYIRCFWGTPRSVYSAGHSDCNRGIVIPDTCMDIIIDIDYSEGSIQGSFCALDENSYFTINNKSASLRSTFAIRFYAWTAALFCGESFKGSKNGSFDPDSFFKGIMHELYEITERFSTLLERARAAEKVLLARLNLRRFDYNVMNAIYDMIDYCGRMKTREIAQKNALSERRFERIFAESIGVSPKTLSNLIRYQLLWQEVCFSRGFDVMDAVLRYGYTDQAHLLKDFKSRHGMTPNQAAKFARDGFLQDSFLIIK